MSTEMWSAESILSPALWAKPLVVPAAVTPAEEKRLSRFFASGRDHTSSPIRWRLLAIVATSIKVLEILSASTELRDKLLDNISYFRGQITKLGLEIIPGEHPIVPIMLGDAVLAQNMADALLKKGVYVIGFSYPVVPKGAARIRTQISAVHSKDDLDFAIEKIAEAKSEL